MIADRVRLDVGVGDRSAQRAAQRGLRLDEGRGFLVADGMGGHDRGEVASRTAIEVLRGLAVGAPTPDDARSIVRDAHAAVRRCPRAPVVGPGTTATGVVLTEHDACRAGSW